MIEAFVALMQAAAVVFLGWGAYLSLFCRDRRSGARTTAGDRRRQRPRIDLTIAARGRATDFEIGFRRKQAATLAR